MTTDLIGILQIITGIIIIILVILQQRGVGLGTIGGLNTFFYGSRRGLEKTIFILTIVLISFFIFLSVLSFII
ncbi:MAG TPA: preprotein translocase subunit SecG [Candidatus Paceibacterota bacterium]|nr:preprotein translocase subunit SecG [Candidatus Paceibacterota bacterium]HPP64889.1 preprotein translocase subunit SecG [Candidatus Paceibacterota bacterium]